MGAHKTIDADEPGCRSLSLHSMAELTLEPKRGYHFLGRQAHLARESFHGRALVPDINSPPTSRIPASRSESPPAS
jgi:hypothetical protein